VRRRRRGGRLGRRGKGDDLGGGGGRGREGWGEHGCNGIDLNNVSLLRTAVACSANSFLPVPLSIQPISLRIRTISSHPHTIVIIKSKTVHS
jgi:hypothetical protein